MNAAPMMDYNEAVHIRDKEQGASEVTEKVP